MQTSHARLMRILCTMYYYSGLVPASLQIHMRNIQAVKGAAIQPLTAVEPSLF